MREDPDQEISENKASIERSRLDEALRKAIPTFVTDGFGLRGPPRQPLRTEDEPRRTDFDRGSIVRPTQPTVTQEISGSQELDATNIDLYGAYNGAPALFHLFQSEPPTSPPP